MLTDQYIHCGLRFPAKVESLIPRIHKLLAVILWIWLHTEISYVWVPTAYLYWMDCQGSVQIAYPHFPAFLDRIGELICLRSKKKMNIKCSLQLNRFTMATA